MRVLMRRYLFGVLIVGFYSNLTDGFATPSNTCPIRNEETRCFTYEFGGQMQEDYEENERDDSNDNYTPPPHNNSSKLLEDERTLYEILGAPQDATRSELKQRYVSLARETHPDATVGLSPQEREEKEVLFTEVAAAWRILSDKRERKRYDRSLVAKEFTRNVEQVAGEYADNVARTAAPVVSKVLETLFRVRRGQDSISLDEAAEQVREAREAKEREVRAREIREAKAREIRLAREQEEREARAQEEQQWNGHHQEQQMEQQTQPQIRDAHVSAINRGRRNGRLEIDRFELLKKSRELEQM